MTGSPVGPPVPQRRQRRPARSGCSRSPDFHARAAATRVLCYWRDRVPDALDLLKKLAADPHPRVRLEAVRAASFFTVPEAVEVALISAEQPTDEYLDYTRGETMKALEPYWQEGDRRGAADPVHQRRRRPVLPQERRAPTSC